MKNRAAVAVGDAITIEPGGHVAWLYEDPAEVAGALSFLADGAQAGEACVCLAYDRYAERMGAQLRDLHGVGARKGSSGEVLFVGGREDPKEIRAELAKVFQRAAREKRPARLLSNLGWGEAGWPDDDGLVALEAQVNGFCEGSGVTALCLYDVRQVRGQLLLRAGLECHPTVLRRGATRQNALYLAPETVLKEVGRRRKEEERLRSWIA